MEFLVLVFLIGQWSIGRCSVHLVGAWLIGGRCSVVGWSIGKWLVVGGWLVDGFKRTLRGHYA